MDPMYGMSPSSSTSAIASHRGVDLGPHRMARQSRRSGTGLHPIERIAPLSASQVPWQAPQLATGPPVRYGSGARFGSRERDRADRRARSTPQLDHRNVASDPGGPQTRQEWIDALNSFDSRVAALERNMNNHASLIAKTNENLIEKHGRINDLANTISENAAKVEQVRLHLEEACTNIAAKYATVNATELAIAQVIGQLDNLRTELMTTLKSQGRSATECPIHTPDDPTAGQVPVAIGEAHGQGPDGQPMWNSRLPPPAFPGAQADGHS